MLDPKVPVADVTHRQVLQGTALDTQGLPKGCHCPPYPVGTQ